MIPEMNVGMGQRITSRKIGQKPAVRASNGFTVRINIAVLPVVIVKQNIRERFNGRVGDSRGKRIEKSVIVQRMRIECREMIHPDAVRCETMTDLEDQRSTATVADQVN